MDAKSGEPPSKRRKANNADRKDPCINGHTTTSNRGWNMDPPDHNRVLCEISYRKLRIERERKTMYQLWEGLGKNEQTLEGE